MVPPRQRTGHTQAARPSSSLLAVYTGIVLGPIDRGMTTALIRRDAALFQIDAARHALERASTIVEVKAIKDTAEAAEIYAKRRQLGEEAEHLAYKIKILALG